MICWLNSQKQEVEFLNLNPVALARVRAVSLEMAIALRRLLYFSNEDRHLTFSRLFIRPDPSPIC